MLLKEEPSKSLTVGVPIVLNKAPTKTGTHSTITETLVNGDKRAGS